jgi:hypothetical protein
MEQTFEKATFEWAKKAPSKDPTGRCVVLVLNILNILEKEENKMVFRRRE